MYHCEGFSDTVALRKSVNLLHFFTFSTQLETNDEQHRIDLFE